PPARLVRSEEARGVVAPGRLRLEAPVVAPHGAVRAEELPAIVEAEGSRALALVGDVRARAGGDEQRLRLDRAPLARVGERPVGPAPQHLEDDRLEGAMLVRNRLGRIDRLDEADPLLERLDDLFVV